jgi:hypothetical protein
MSDNTIQVTWKVHMGEIPAVVEIYPNNVHFPRVVCYRVSFSNGTAQLMTKEDIASFVTEPDKLDQLKSKPQY